jgi:hypothetical protein
MLRLVAARRAGGMACCREYLESSGRVLERGTPTANQNIVMASVRYHPI